MIRVLARLGNGPEQSPITDHTVGKTFLLASPYVILDVNDFGELMNEARFDKQYECPGAGDCSQAGAGSGGT